MAKPSSRKLKVFQAQVGFFDTVVAASSQAAALRTWGIHQDLFADGRAGEVTDEDAVAAALAHPETPLRRAIGSSDPFRLEPTSLPTLPDAPKTPRPVPAAASKRAPPPRPPADRSQLDAAEAALRDLDERRKREEAELRREADALDARRAAAQAAYVAARKTATRAIVAAREAYRKAGGSG